jgi:hypothetical protein
MWNPFRETLCDICTFSIFGGAVKDWELIAPNADTIHVVMCQKCDQRLWGLLKQTQERNRTDHG